MSLVLSNKDARGVATLTLNRVDKLNAFSLEMIDELTAAAEELAKDQSLRAVVVKSASSKAFCAGADLAERITFNEQQVSDVLAKQRRMVDAVAALPVPVIAVLEGAAFGGGFELALACDLRVCSPSAKLGLTEVRLAIIPGAGGTQRLTRLIGEARAKELIFTARRVEGVEAAKLGLVHTCCENPSAQADLWLADILEAGPLAMRAAKSAIDGGHALPLAKALDWERDCYERVLYSHDRVEGLKSFSEKRKASFKGK